MERQPLKLDVVSADRMVWQGDVVNVIARTSAFFRAMSL